MQPATWIVGILIKYQWYQIAVTVNGNEYLSW